MREYTGPEDAEFLQSCGIKPFASARYPRESISSIFAVSAFQSIVHERDLRAQLFALYTSAAYAEQHQVPYTHSQLSWMLRGILYSPADVYAEERYFLEKVLSIIPDDSDPVEFNDIRQIVNGLDPELYREVRHAVPAARAHR